jgi:hypothetical protein
VIGPSRTLLSLEDRIMETLLRNRPSWVPIRSGTWSEGFSENEVCWIKEWSMGLIGGARGRRRCREEVVSGVATECTEEVELSLRAEDCSSMDSLLELCLAAMSGEDAEDYKQV